MLQQVLEFIHQKNWGDAASVLGVAISVTGFGFTLVGLARSKSAAKQVAAAVADVREKLALKNLAAEVSKLMSDIEEVKALHRIGAWQAMPNRYASLRFRLHSLKGARVFRTQEASIQSVIEAFKEIEETVEKELAARELPSNVAALNKRASDQSDRLVAVLMALERSLERV